MPCRAAEDSSLASPDRIPGTARTTSHLPGRQRRERCISSCSPWFSSVDCRLALLLPRIQRARYGNQLDSVRLNGRQRTRQKCGRRGDVFTPHFGTPPTLQRRTRLHRLGWHTSSLIGWSCRTSRAVSWRRPHAPVPSATRASRQKLTRLHSCRRVRVVGLAADTVEATS